MAQINNLPIEILLHIISFLPRGSLTLRDLSQTSVLFRTLIGRVKVRLTPYEERLLLARKINKSYLCVCRKCMKYTPFYEIFRLPWSGEEDVCFNCGPGAGTQWMGQVATWFDPSGAVDVGRAGDAFRLERDGEFIRWLRDWKVQADLAVYGAQNHRCRITGRKLVAIMIGRWMEAVENGEGWKGKEFFADGVCGLSPCGGGGLKRAVMAAWYYRFRVSKRVKFIRTNR